MIVTTVDHAGLDHSRSEPGECQVRATADHLIVRLYNTHPPFLNKYHPLFPSSCKFCMVCEYCESV